MFCLLWQVALCFVVLTKVSCETWCDVKNNAVSCNGRKLNNVPNEIVARIKPDEVLKLDLSDNHLDTITAGSFRNFSKIEEIVIANGRVSSIENGAFEGLHQLLTLNLTNNNLSELKSKVLKSNSNLQFLILSNNKIESWDNFKVSDLVSLLYLDISGNKFTYLPQDILKLLDDHPTFTIVLDDNPWDCNNEILKNSNIAKYICETTVDGSADSVTNQARVEATTVDNSTNDTIGAFQPTSDMPPNVCVVKNRRNLLPIWLALAIVVGIIIGNGDRIYGWVNAKCGRKHVARRRTDEETALK